MPYLLRFLFAASIVLLIVETSGLRSFFSVSKVLILLFLFFIVIPVRYFRYPVEPALMDLGHTGNRAQPRGSRI